MKKKLAVDPGILTYVVCDELKLYSYDVPKAELLPGWRRVEAQQWDFVRRGYVYDPWAWNVP